MDPDEIRDANSCDKVLDALVKLSHDEKQPGRYSGLNDLIRFRADLDRALDACGYLGVYLPALEARARARASVANGQADQFLSIESACHQEMMAGVWWGGEREKYERFSHDQMTSARRHA